TGANPLRSGSSADDEDVLALGTLDLLARGVVRHLHPHRTLGAANDLGHDNLISEVRDQRSAVRKRDDCSSLISDLWPLTSISFWGVRQTAGRPYRPGSCRHSS